MLSLLPGWLPRDFPAVKFWIHEHRVLGWADRWKLGLVFIFFFPQKLPASPCLWVF